MQLCSKGVNMLANGADYYFPCYETRMNLVVSSESGLNYLPKNQIISEL